MIGEKVSHYKIIEKLGSGGMGEVYKAEDIKLKRTVALKFLPSSFSFDQEAKKRFTNEAQSASALDHPNICTIHEIGETVNGQLFISMACYEGKTLKEKIAKGAMNIDEALDITLQICEGLKKAHHSKITHRDIKPANIFITKDGVVKILDFGLAKTKGQSHLTQIGATIGTIDYMSPEQARGEEVDQKTDIWSLGIVMYEMLTGKLPFKGDYDQAIIYSILNEEPDLISLPKEILPVIRKAIAKSPKERYQFVEEIINDLVSLKGSATKKYNLLVFPRRIRLKIKIAVVLLIIIPAILYFVTKPFNNTVAVPERKMIVILPFENLGPSENEYFAKGMREEISNKLASLGSIGVISRNSAEKFAKSNKTTKEIAKELGVDYVLEGTVQWAKIRDKTSRIRIIPQLIRASDDVNIWSDSYDRTMTDIFDVQNEIAQNVVNKLGVKILPNQFSKGPPPTNNPDAYDFYLKALQFHYGPSTGANIKTCVKLYEKAIELDSNFAAAHAEISIAYMGLFKWYWDRDSLNLKKASEHLKKAKELNPNLADVHLAQFFYNAWFLGDRELSFQELKKILEIQPNNAEAAFQISGFYWKKGRLDLSKQYDSKCMQLDPLNARYPWGIGIDYNLRKDYKTADKYFKRAIEISPNTSQLYAELAENYIDWKGNTQLAWQAAKNIKDDEYLEAFCNIFIYLKILDRKFTEAIIELKSSSKKYEDSYNAYTPNSQMIALLYRYMGKGEFSKKYFDSSRVEMEKMLRTTPEQLRLRRSLSISYAGLGKKENAINENIMALKLIPSKNEKEHKYVQAEDLAKITTLIGEYNNALKQIDFLLSNPTGFSLNRLKLDPLYDPLRNQPDYKNIVEKYSNEKPE